MNPEALCAKCEHLIIRHRPNRPPVYECAHRNTMTMTYSTVMIEKGFKTCKNFKPRKEQNNG